MKMWLFSINKYYFDWNGIEIRLKCWFCRKIERFHFGSGCHCYNILLNDTSWVNIRENALSLLLCACAHCSIFILKHHQSCFCCYLRLFKCLLQLRYYRNACHLSRSRLWPPDPEIAPLHNNPNSNAQYQFIEYWNRARNKLLKVDEQ